MPDDALRYPIGRFQPLGPLPPKRRAELVEALAALPGQVRALVAPQAAPLTEAQLATPYRPQGWTLRQVVHHLPDSHLNAYVRMKLALTEDHPTIKPFDESLWAELPDVAATPVAASLDLLEALHLRWTALLRHLPPSAFARGLTHPEVGPMTLDDVLALYAWHGRHHLAHLQNALQTAAVSRAPGSASAPPRSG